MADANVFAQLIRPVRSVSENMAELDRLDAGRLQLEGQRRQNALQDAAFQQQTQKQNALRAAAASWGPTTTDEQRIQSLRANPLTFDAADALEKSTLERGKTRAAVAKDEAEAEKIRLASDYMKRDRHLQGLANVTDPQQAAAWIGQGVQLGEFSMQQAQQVIQGLQSGQIPLDQWKQRAQQGGMTLQQQAQDRLAQLTQAETQRHNQSTEKLTARGQDMTASTAIRGQNMTDARSREANQLTREANANVYDTERGVLVNKATGLARPAATMDGKPIGAKDKPLTEGQAKAYAFGSRMAAANEIIDRLQQEGTTKTVPGMSGNGAMGRVVTALAPEKQQLLEQAKRDWLNANLRRESGALIGESEFASGDRQYFPQPGDGPEVIKQKAANRKMAEQGVLVEVPDAKRPKATAALDTPGLPEDIAAIMKKHGGKPGAK